MKKILLVVLCFVFANSVYSQDINATGVLVYGAGGAGTGTTPFLIAKGPSGSKYVAYGSSQGSQILKYSDDSTVGEVVGVMNFSIISMCVDKNSNIYTYGFGRLYRFSAGNTNPTLIYQRASEEGYICVDNDDNLYLSVNPGIYKFNSQFPSGTLIISATYSGPNGAMSFGNGITVDDENTLYTADNSKRILKFPLNNSTGIVIGNCPYTNAEGGIAVDDSKNVYVARTSYIQRFTPGNLTGTVVAGTHTAGSALNRLGAGGSRIMVTSSMELFIADNSNNRVVKWNVSDPNHISGSVFRVLAYLDGRANCEGTGVLSASTQIFGAPPFQYSLSNTQTSEERAFGPYQTDSTFTVPQNTNPSAGSYYRVKIKDFFGEEAESSVLNLAIKEKLNVEITSISKPSSPTSSDGSITIATQENFGYAIVFVNEELINSIPGTLTIPNLSAGTYNIRVQHGFYQPNSEVTTCSVTKVVTLHPGLAVSLINKTSPSNEGASDGSIEVIASGGSGSGYSYTLNGVEKGTNSSFTNLSPGVYSITAKDDSLNISQELTVSLEAVVLPAVELVLISKNQTSSESAIDGRIEVGVTGGSGSGYTFSLNGVDKGASAIFNNLPVGTYSIVARDGNQNISNTLEITISAAAALSATITGINGSCDGPGSLTISPIGGSGIYTSYFLNDGEEQSFYGNNYSLTNLSAGTYSVKIKDSEGNLSPASNTVTVVIGQQPTLTLNITHINAGTSTGSVSVNVSGGSGSGYKYYLSNHNYFLYYEVTSPDFSNLPAGSYNTFVDDNGCYSPSHSFKIYDSANKVQPEVYFDVYGQFRTGDTVTLNVSSSMPEFPMVLTSSDPTVVSVFKANTGTPEIWKAVLHESGAVSITATQPANDYIFAAEPVTRELHIQQTSILSFPEIAPKTFADASFDLVATSSTQTQAPIYFSSSDPSIVSVSNSTGTWKAEILATGDVTIYAIQDETPESSYAQVEQQLSIGAAVRQSVINFPELPPHTEGEPGYTDFQLFPLSSNSTSEGALSSTNKVNPILLTSSDASIATLFKSGARWYIKIFKAGTITITATQGGDANHLAAVPVSRTLLIKPGIKPIGIASVTPSVETGMDYISMYWNSTATVIQPTSGVNDPNQRYVDLTIKLRNKTKLARILFYKMAGSSAYPISVYAVNGNQKVLLSNFNGTITSDSYTLQIDSSIVADAIIIHKYQNYLPQKIFVYGYVVPSSPILPIRSELRLDIPAEKNMGDPDFTVMPVKNPSWNNIESPITLTSSDPSTVALINTGNNSWRASILKEGSVTITANQAGSTNYSAAESVVKTLTIKPADLREQAVISLSSFNQDSVSRDSIFNIVATSTNAAVPITIVSSDTSIVKVYAVNGIWKGKILRAGDLTITASQLGNETYKPAVDVSHYYNVDPEDIWGNRLIIASITPSEQTGMDYFNWWNDDLTKLVQNTTGAADPNQKWVDITLKFTQNAKVARVSLYDIVGQFPEYPVEVYTLNGTQRILIGTWTGQLTNKFFNLPADTSLISDGIVIRKFGNKVPQKVQAYGFTIPNSPISLISTDLKIIIPDTVYLGTSPSVSTRTNRTGTVTFTTSNSNVMRLVSGRRGSSWQVFTAGQAIITGTQAATSTFTSATATKLVTVVDAPINTEFQIPIANIASTDDLDYFPWWFINSTNFEVKTNSTSANYSDVVLKLTQRSKLYRVSLYDGLGEFLDHPASIYALNGSQKIFLGTFSGELNNEFVDIKVSGDIEADGIIVSKYGNGIPQKVIIYGNPLPNTEIKITSVLNTNDIGPLPSFYVGETKQVYPVSGEPPSNNSNGWTFESSDPSVFSVFRVAGKGGGGDRWSGTAFKEGTVTLTVTHPGNDNYEPAQGVSRSLTITSVPTKGTATITFPVLPAKAAGDTVLLNASSSNIVAPLTITSSDASTASVFQSTGKWYAALLKQGTVTFTASQAADDDFYAPENASRSYTVNCAPPSAPLISANKSTNLCAGDSVILTATGQNIVWSTGKAGGQLTVSTAGTYTATAADACGTSKPSASITINVGSGPVKPSLAASGQTDLCVGESVTLTTGATTGFKWFKDNVALTTVTAATYDVVTAGTYHVVSTDSCGTISSDPIVITVKPVVPQSENFHAQEVTTASEITTCGSNPVFTWTGAGDTIFSNPLNWKNTTTNENNQLPPNNGMSRLVIPSGLSRYPVMIRDYTAGSLTLQSGASLDLNGYELNVLCDIANNNGQIKYSNKRTSGIAFSGTGTQNYNNSGSTSSASWGALRVNKSDGGQVNLNGPVNVYGQVTVTKGILNSNGKMTLKATYNNTYNAGVGPLLNGAAVVGDVNVEYYFTGKVRASRTIASPINDALLPLKSYKQLQKYSIISGPGGAANGFDPGGASAPYSVSINGYKESVRNAQFQFIPLPNINQSLSPGEGSLFYYRGNRDGYTPETASTSNKVNFPFAIAEDQTVVYTGPLNQGNFTINLSFTPHPGEEKRNGTNLVGNPYAAILNWNVIREYHPNLFDFITIFKPADATQINGVITDTDTLKLPYLKAGQGFYLQTDAPSTLTFKESYKVVPLGNPCGSSDFNITKSGTATSSGTPYQITLKEDINAGIRRNLKVNVTIVNGFTSQIIPDVPLDSLTNSGTVLIPANYLTYESQVYACGFAGPTENDLTCAMGAASVTVEATPPAGATMEYTLLPNKNWQTSPVFTNLAPGFYRIASRSVSQGCYSREVAIDVTLKPGTGTAPFAPVITAENSEGLCEDDSVTLSATGTGIIWSNGKVGNSIKVSAAGKYSAVSKTYCGISAPADSITVSLGAKPARPTIAAVGSKVIINGSTVTLVAQGENIKWSNGIQNDTLIVTQEGTYTATSSNTCGESLASDTIRVTTGQLPVPPVISSLSTELCGKTPITLRVAKVDGQSVLWSNGETKDSITVTKPGNYHAKAWNAYGTSAISNIITITPNTQVLPVPVVTAVYSADSSQVFLTATGGTNIKWSNGATGNLLIVSEEDAFFARSSNDCGVSAPSDTITVVTRELKPCVPIISTDDNTEICAGDSVILTSTGMGIVWNTGAEGNTLVVKEPGDYIAVASNDVGTSMGSNVITVKVKQGPPAPRITVDGDTEICNGSSVTLTATGSYVRWSNGQIGNTITVTTAGNYSATDWLDCAKSESSDTISIKVSSPPTPPVISIISGSSELSPGSTVMLTATGEGIEWSTGEITDTITVNREGNYTATASNSCGVSATSNAITLVSNTVPTTPVISTVGPPVICGDYGVTLIASTTGESVLWSNGEIGHQIIVTSPGVYTATATNNIGTSEVSNSFTVEASTIPDAPLVTVEGSTILSGGSTVTLNATGEGIKWSNGQEGNSIIVRREGVYTATASNVCNVSAISNAITLTSNEPPIQPVLSFEGDTVLYEGSSVTLTAETTGLQVVWSNGDVGDKLVVTTPGTYTATAYNPKGASVMAYQITVPAPKPPLEVTHDDLDVCGNEWIEFFPFKNAKDHTGGSGKLQIINMTVPANGEVKKVKDGYYNYKYYYRPKPGFTGTDSFAYTIKMIYGDVKYNKLNDRYYEYVNDNDRNWYQANTLANHLNYSGLKGYLATITSAAENNFVKAIFKGQAWIGMRDKDWEKHWKWVTGPENGKYIDGIYTNWRKYKNPVKKDEPNNGGTWYGGEDSGVIYADGTWNDLNSTKSFGYLGAVVEYGGPGFGTFIPITTATATVNINVAPPIPTPTITAEGPTGLCVGGSVTLTSSDAESYRWNMNGNPMPYNTSKTLTVYNPGIYTVTVKSGECSATSLPIKVTNPINPFTPSIAAQGPTTMCAGGITKLKATSISSFLRNFFPIGKTTIKWYLGTIPVGMGQTFDATIGGVYTAKESNGCIESTASNPITIKVDNTLAVKTSAFDQLVPKLPYPSMSPEEFAQMNLNAQKDMELEVLESCESQAKNWLRSLSGSTLTPAQKTSLIDKFVSICKAAGTQPNDYSHPMGASSLPAGVTVNGLNSFGDAIKSVSALNTFSADLNPWLIEFPYPYEVQPQLVSRNLSATNAELCAKLAQVRQELGNPATNEAFYNSLTAKYKDGMTLDLDELKMLTTACGNCKYLLEDEIAYPVFLSPASAGCISTSNYAAAIDALTQAVAGLSPAHKNYKKVLTNFMNQRFGFSMSYADYAKFATLPASSGEVLCGKPLFGTYALDPYEDFKTQIATAVGGAQAEYASYEAKERKKFMLDYVNICSAANVSAKLESKQSVYHYTLYYYDVAGNLIRTVPPESVDVLSTEEVNWVEEARNHKESAIVVSPGFPTADSPKPNVLEQLTNSFNPGNSAVEMWLYNPNSAFNQVLATTLEPGTGDKKYMMQACLDGKYLNIELYSLDHSNASNPQVVTFNNLNRAAVDITNTPIHPWTHLVVQSADFTAGTMQIYLDGKLATQVTNAPPALCSWEVKGTAGMLQMPENLSSVKYMRLYDKQLSTQEIVANAKASNFMLAEDPALQQSLRAALGNRWYRFNTPEPGSETIASGSTSVETKYAPIYPAHGMTTSYAYNSSNQVVKQSTPDGGISQFWYDKLSRLVVSQNEKQLNAKNNIGVNTPDFSYTEYDLLGRISEVGQKNFPGGVSTLPNYLGNLLLSNNDYKDFLTKGENSQLTQTHYDALRSDEPGIPSNLIQNNSRKRVVASVYRPTPTSANINATYYDYDLNGNVKTLWQQIDGLDELKKIEYEFDLVSGKVNKVHYQKGKADRFFYDYEYDSENRLITVYNGTDAYNAKMVASYQYYLHGPLARMELGDKLRKVQGLDYAYTLQGWLKGVNGQALNPDTEMGKDGPFASNSTKDAFGYSLGYYKGDYNPIAAGSSAFAMQYQPQAVTPQTTERYTGLDLYNGNISNTTVAISKIGGDKPFGYSYRYDQLNRLMEMSQKELSNATTTWTANAINPDEPYKESFKYDASGNIEKLVRNGSVDNVLMDNLEYMYTIDPATGKKVNNKLLQVKDAVVASTYTEDIEGQDENNYEYDGSGNLLRDIKEGSNKITWTLYDKIRSIEKAGSTISYTYDAAGHRVSKTFTPANGTGIITYYLRDAQGNSLGLYEKNASNQIVWKEQILYGSSRLGMFKPETNVNEVATDKNVVSGLWSNYIGYQNYELNNHLQNVLAVITDKRTVTSNGSYEAELLNAQDYYAFGSLMPGRRYSLSSDVGYRYGFNGKENDNEVKGVEGSQQDYGMRIYNPQLGRFLSIDPLSKAYPFYSPYHFAGNSPIENIDMDGLEVLSVKTLQSPMFNLLTYSKGIDAIAENVLKPAAAAVFKAAFKEALPKKFIDHWVFGGGQTYHLNKTEVAQLHVYPTGIEGVIPRDKEKFDRLIAKAKRGETITLPEGYSMQANASTGGTLNRFHLEMKGTITFDSKDKTKWTFTGQMRIFDIYDFNTAPIDPNKDMKRAEWGDVQTDFALKYLPGDKFEVKSDWINVSQTSNQNWFPWFKGYTDGPQNRISELTDAEEFNGVVGGLKREK